MSQQKPNAKNNQSFPSSPPWVRSLKLFALGWMMLFAVGTVYYFSDLALYILLGIVLSYMIRPIVDTVDDYVKLPRGVLTAVIYLILVGAILAYPLSTLPSLIRQVLSFINNLPDLIQLAADNIVLFLQTPITFRGETYTIPLNESYQEYIGQAISLVSSAISSLRNVAGGLASSTVEFFTWLVFVLFLSFRLSLFERGQLSSYLYKIMPDGYTDDSKVLVEQLDTVWGAFLRGQVVLMIVIGVVVFIVASLLGLPNAIALGVIAGLFELIPYIGPLLAAIPGALLAFFQADASWLGSMTSPFWFMVIVIIAYWLIQQLENYILVPRILGWQLKLHPVVVFVAAIAGFQLAGILGILFASPMVATLRLVFHYAWCKITDQPSAVALALPIELIDAVDPVPKPTQKPEIITEKSETAPTD